MSDQKNASMTKRLLAITYDAILLCALLLLASATALISNNNEPIPSGSLWMMIWLLFVGFLYYGISWKISGQTLGLRTWRLRILSDDHTHLTWQTAIVRYFVSLVLFFSVIGFLWMWFDKQNRTAYDILCRSKVIDEKPQKS